MSPQRALAATILLLATAAAVEAQPQTQLKVTTIAGMAGDAASLDGQGSEARFKWPMGVAVDSAGNVYIADPSDAKVRKITPGGLVSTYVSGLPGYGPHQVAVDSAGNLYVDQQLPGPGGAASIVKIAPDLTVTTVASGLTGFSPYWSGIAIGPAGELYLAATGAHTILKVEGGVVSTLAGETNVAGFVDGTGSAARFRAPMGLAFDPTTQVLYVAEGTLSGSLSNSAIRKVTLGGDVTTVAVGVGEWNIAVDGAGDLYASGETQVRRVTAAGAITTVASGFGSADGTGDEVGFYKAAGIAVDATGAVYIADTNNFTVRRGRLVTLDASSASFPNLGGGGPLQLEAHASDDWVAVSDQDWLTVSPPSGTGNGMVTYSVFPNFSPGVRTATARVAGLRFRVTQAAGVFNVVPLIFDGVSGAGLVETLTLTMTPAATPWTTEAPDWISLSPPSGTGPGPVTMTVALNPGVPRGGFITIGGVNVRVTQGACPVAVQPAQIVMGATSAIGTFNIVTAPDCPWTMSNERVWLTGGPTSGTGSAAITYQVDHNLSPSGRSGALRINGSTFTVNQESENGPVSPPGAPQGFAATITGTAVGFAWGQPASGGFASNYLLEVGTGPGLTNLGTYPTGTAATTYAVVGVPIGRYTVRLRAANARGLGPASNEIEVLVGIVQPPNPPTNLIGTLTGGNLSLSWVPAATGGPPAQYILEAGSGPGLTNIASVPTGTTFTTFQYSGVPAGRYFLRVRAQNTTGVSAVSNELELVAGTGAALPPPPTGLTATMSGATLTLTWTAGSGGGPTTTYVISAGTNSSLSNLGSVPTGTTLTSWTFSGVPPGTYFVRVRALNANGLSAASNEVIVVSGG